MSEELNGKKVAILSTDGFEQSELFEPKKALEAAGAEVVIVSLRRARSRVGTKITGARASMWTR
jgi:putative intracellular protease/amidase